MRFRKSIKLGKGMRINFSNSGISSSFGMKGLSTSVGKQGVYLNLGIPGTGLSSRHKLIGAPSFSTKSKKNSRSTTPSYSESIEVKMNDNGEIQFYDSLGRIVTDPNKVRKVKSTEQFKEWKAEKMQEQYDKVNGETDQIISIHTLSPDVLTESQYRKMLDNIVLKTYIKEKYSVGKPSEFQITQLLESKAKQEITSWKFWIVSKKRRQYVQDNLEYALKDAIEKWEEEKSIFEKKQEQLANIENQHYQAEFQQKTDFIKQSILGDYEFVIAEIEKWLKTVILPVDFALQFDYVEDVLWLDIDLPEIEDLPNEKAIKLASGTTKVKPKTQKEKKEDYINCTFGLAIFFASNLYNISPKINQIVVSGYTQRSSSKTTDVKDEYVYSIKFERSKFEKKNFAKLSFPFDFCMEFENRCNVSSTLVLKSIEPFEK